MSYTPLPGGASISEACIVTRTTRSFFDEPPAAAFCSGSDRCVGYYTFDHPTLPRNVFLTVEAECSPVSTGPTGRSASPHEPSISGLGFKSRDAPVARPVASQSDLRGRDEAPQSFRLGVYTCRA